MYLASRFGISRPTDPVSSSSGYVNIVAIDEVSVIPQTWVNGVPSWRSVRNRVCTSLSSGAAPQMTFLMECKNGRVRASGDVRMAMAMGGTMVRSVAWYFSLHTRYGSRSKRRIM